MNKIKTSNAYKQKRTEYFCGIRHDMLRFVPKKCTSILEIGCGAGYFGELLKQKLGAHVTGVELDFKAAALAEKKIDKVFVGDFTTISDQLPNHHFQCAILNDVIEHVFDPLELLSLVTSKLK